MDNKYRDEVLIDKYLDGELSGMELEEFEKRLAREEDLMVSLQIEKGLREIHRENDVLDFREEVGAVIESMKVRDGSVIGGKDPAESSGKKKDAPVIPIYRRSKVLLAAASVVLVAAIAVVLYFISGQGGRSAAGLFAEFYEPYPADGAVRSEGAGNDDEAKAMEYYASGNYKEATDLLKSLTLKHPRDDKFRFYYAISLIENDDLFSAQNELGEIAGEDTGYFREQARWYLALVLIKQDQKDRAGELLEQIVAEKGYNANKAKGLLESLAVKK